jgi:hypothetical protein
MSNRADTVLIQQASGNYKALLALTAPFHIEYCERHGLDYWPIFGETQYVSHRPLAHYNRVSLLLTAFQAGYKQAIWLDADCVLNWQSEEDIRGGVPASGMGVLWCAGDWHDPSLYDHWCTGALYVQNDLRTHDFLHKWLWTADDEGHGWVDQHSFNNLAKDKEFQGMMKPLSRKFHSILPNYPPEDDTIPLVVAFHGYADLQGRYDAMSALFQPVEDAQEAVKA